MRILVANKFWYHRGGLERVMFDEIRWLEAAGHEVAHFSTQHPLNEPSPWSHRFAPYLELGEGTEVGARDKLRAAVRLFYNREAARRFTRVLLEFRPDVVHVHGIHRQLSPSVLVAARDRRVPVVQTLHDYHAFCAGDRLLRGDGTACDPPRCRLGRVAPALSHRCVRGDLAQSALSAAELSFRTRALSYQSLVAVFVSPSRFLAEVMRAAGFTQRPIEVVPNAIEPPPVAKGGGQEGGDREADDFEGRTGFVYAGRLSYEKGLDVLLAAAGQAQVPLTIAGEGPLADLVRAHGDAHTRASTDGDLDGRAHGRVRWLGAVPPDDVMRLLRTATAAVVPSTWFENAPLSVLEPMACGVPVVASAVGGVPELIRDGEDGLLVEPGSIDALARALRAFADEPERAQACGARARERAAAEFAPQAHIDGLLQCYENAREAVA